MPLFGSLMKGPAVQAGAAQAVTPQLSLADKLSLIGGVFKDLSTGGDTFEQRQQAIAARALMQRQLDAQKQLGGLFQGPTTTSAPAAPLPDAASPVNLFAGGQYGPAPTQTFGGDSQAMSGGIPSIEDAAPILVRAQAAGVNVTPYLEILKAAQPDGLSVSPGATVIDKRTGKVIARGAPDSGVADGFGYTKDPVTGQVVWQGQRPMTYAEQLARDQFGYQQQHDRATDLIRATEAGASASNAKSNARRTDQDITTGGKPKPWDRSWN